MGESSNLKVSVWSSFAPGREMIMAATGDDSEAQNGVRQLSGDGSDNLHKEVFGWRIHEDPFGGIAKPNDRDALKTALLESFSMAVAPHERSISKLRTIIDQAEAIIKKGGVEWTGSQSALGDSDRRVNPLIGLVNQLGWIIEIYDEHPDISITIR